MLFAILGGAPTTFGGAVENSSDEGECAYDGELHDMLLEINLIFVAA